MEQLAKQLNELCDAQPYFISWCVRDLASGISIHRNGDTEVPSASTRKTSIMMAALKAAGAHKLDLDEQIIIQNQHFDGVESGVLRYMTPGIVLPLRDLIVQMIITSDNVATRLIVERLGVDALNAYCQSIDLNNTIHRFAFPPPGLAWDHPIEWVTTTTANDQCKLFDLMLAGASDPVVAQRMGCTPELVQYALDILAQQMHRQMIPSLLPFGTRVANKTGWSARGRMDAGVVYRGQDPAYIITAYTDWVPDEMEDGIPGYCAAYSVIGRLSRMCWERLLRQAP